MQLLRGPELKRPEHLMEGAAPGEALEVRCRHCQDRVLLVTAERADALTVVAQHMIVDHKLQGQFSLVVEGVDMLLAPTPYRCDLCCSIVEPPWWTYTTSAELEAEDAQWLVCDTCHGLVGSRGKPLRSLVERAFQVQTREFILDGVPTAKVRAALKHNLSRFLLHLQGQPVRGGL